LSATSTGLSQSDSGIGSLSRIVFVY